MDKNKEGLRALLSLRSGEMLMGLSVGFYSSAQEVETSRNKKTRTLCLLKSETVTFCSSFLLTLLCKY